MASVQARQLDRTAGLQATFAAAMDMETNISILSTNDDDGDYEDAIIEIEHLHSLGVPSADISKLKSAGVVSVAGAMMTSKKAMMEIKGLTEPKIERIIGACNQMSTAAFISAADLLQKRKSIIKITTGSSALDSILRGGIESKTITEVFGESGTGKTQLMHTLCVTSQLDFEFKGGNGKVAYIDTGGSFYPERIVDIAQRYGIDAKMTLDNILVARAYSHEQQNSLLTAVAAMMVKDQFSLLIVDSFTSLFRVEFVGREELAPRQQAIASMMNKLSKIASEFNICVVITNQVMSDPSRGSASALTTESRKPVGGHVIAHASNTRLSLRKGLMDKRICKVYESPCLPESEAIFRITEGGISDV